jgi:hypothetical protein
VGRYEIMEFGTAGFALVFLVAVAVLGPVLGADSRDGRDWRPTGPRTTRTRLLDRTRRQIALWEAYLTSHQAWRAKGPLRWRKEGDTWVLDGEVAPADYPKTADDSPDDDAHACA